MARVLKKKITRPIPQDAVIIERAGKRYAQYKGKDGRQRKDPLNASGRIVVDSQTYYCEYTDESGIHKNVSTGCKDADAARAILNEHLKQVELLRAGVITAKDMERADANAVSVEKHIADYVEWLTRTDKTKKHADGVRYYLTDLAKRNNWRKLSDMTRDGLERAMRDLQDDGLSARTANVTRISAVAFANWGIRQGILSVNPFAGIPKANEAADPRRQRRAFSHDELVALLDAAEQRPLHDALHGNRGDEPANLTPRTIERLQRTGRERRLFYWLLATTGLRVNEARSLRLADVDLDSKPARVHLRASTTKNRQDDTLPLRDELAEALRAWIADRRVVSFKPDSEMLFTGIADKMTKVFDRDIALAGIPKRDARGRTVDVHALRHTFATSLARAKVPVQIAQKLLRHATPAMTLNIYTHCELGDFNAAVQALPTMGREQNMEVITQTVNGQKNVAGNVAGDNGKTCTQTAFHGIEAAKQDDGGEKEKSPKTSRKSAFSGDSTWWAVGDSNTRHPACKAGALTN